MEPQLSEFLRYLSSLEEKDSERLPTLAEISHEMGVSISSLREQLEVARVLGFVDVRPKCGIKRLPYSFLPTVFQSLSYGVQISPNLFQAYSDLRNHIESAYFYQAVGLLMPDDHDYMKKLVISAKEKIVSKPIRIPHWEHREFHLVIFRRLNNLFVIGLLEAYWQLYEAVGLSVYADINYFKQVWAYHEKIVESLVSGDYPSAYLALMDHMGLLTTRPVSIPNHKFE
jgi:DNA-binding FadR family transcriptional regulator